MISLRPSPRARATPWSATTGPSVLGRLNLLPSSGVLMLMPRFAAVASARASTSRSASSSSPSLDCSGRSPCTSSRPSPSRSRSTRARPAAPPCPTGSTSSHGTNACTPRWRWSRRSRAASAKSRARAASSHDRCLYLFPPHCPALLAPPFPSQHMRYCITDPPDPFVLHPVAHICASRIPPN